MHPQMPPQRPMQYPQPQYAPMHGPPPGWRPPFTHAISVLYLAAVVMPLLAVAILGEELAAIYRAAFNGGLNSQGWLLAVGFASSTLLAASCLSNGIVRLATGRRWVGGAWTALAFATAALGAWFGVVVYLASNSFAVDAGLLLYLLGAPVAAVAACVGAFSSR